MQISNHLLLCRTVQRLFQHDLQLRSCRLGKHGRTSSLPFRLVTVVIVPLLTTAIDWCYTLALLAAQNTCIGRIETVYTAPRSIRLFHLQGIACTLDPTSDDERTWGMRRMLRKVRTATDWQRQCESGSTIRASAHFRLIVIKRLVLSLTSSFRAVLISTPSMTKLYNE